MGATHSLLASPSHEEQPYLQFLPSLAAAAAIPKAGDEKAGSELMAYWKSRAGLCICARLGLNSANKTKTDATQSHGWRATLKH